jgi:hypothetical protein
MGTVPPPGGGYPPPPPGGCDWADTWLYPSPCLARLERSVPEHVLSQTPLLPTPLQGMATSRAATPPPLLPGTPQVSGRAGRWAAGVLL